jgi:hypothetical protein
VTYGLGAAQAAPEREEKEDGHEQRQGARRVAPLPLHLAKHPSRVATSVHTRCLLWYQPLAIDQSRSMYTTMAPFYTARERVRSLFGRHDPMSSIVAVMWPMIRQHRKRRASEPSHADAVTHVVHFVLLLSVDSCVNQSSYSQQADAGSCGSRRFGDGFFWRRFQGRPPQGGLSVLNYSPSNWRCHI